MRLIYIANIRLPTEKAHGIQIMKMCDAFTRSGVEVTLVVPTRRNLELAHVDPFDYYHVDRVFTIRTLLCADPEFLMRFPGSAYTKMQRVLFARAVKLFLSSSGIAPDDIFYTRDEHILSAAQEFSNIVVWEAHTLPRNTWMYRRAWKKCRAIFPITEHLRQELIEQGIDEKKLIVARDGVDLSKFKIQISKSKIRERLGLSQEKRIILYTGHLYEWKGAGVLLDVARNFQFPISSNQINSKFQTRLPTPVDNQDTIQGEDTARLQQRGEFQGKGNGGQVPNSRRGVVFVFVGGTASDVQHFKHNATAMQLNNVLIVGHRPHDEIPQWLAAADVVILPNSGKTKISQYYTSPMKLFEYMASGTPIIASDLPSIREVLNEHNAVLVAPDSPEAFGKGMQRILEDPERAQRMSAQALQDVQQYDWQKRAQGIINVIFQT